MEMEMQMKMKMRRTMRLITRGLSKYDDDIGVTQVEIGRLGVGRQVLMQSKEARIASEVEANQKRIKRLLEKQHVLRRKGKQGWMIEHIKRNEGVVWRRIMDSIDNFLHLFQIFGSGSEGPWFCLILWHIWFQKLARLPGSGLHLVEEAISLQNKAVSDALSMVLKGVNEHLMVRHEDAEALGSIAA
ncbi:hypothetical protein Tco_0532473 [Tanacetum coccineum]